MFRLTALAALFATAPLMAHANDGFDQCLAKLRTEAGSKGVTQATFDRYAANQTPDMDIIALLDRQPEFTTPIWDYMAGLVDDRRVTDGREMLQRWAPPLAETERQYGGDAAAVVAIWGVESDYGRIFGKRPVVESLATLSCIGRRQAFFRGELFHALKILQEGHVTPDSFTGSWAGAFGHTQFMPSTFNRIAVDFDGDGRRDLIGNIPDALASTANYLARSGWRTDARWGFEVRLPENFDASRAGRKNKQPMSTWASHGVRRVDGSALPADSTSAGLLLPAGDAGPAFLVLRNFDAIYSYNAAESYSLAIAHLSDRIRGGNEFVTPWPTDDPGLSRAERREVQERLIALGHDIGEVDGIIGTQPRRAIQPLQPALNLKPDGRAGQKLLNALREKTAG